MPGRQITIYRPSLKLSDYRMEFQASIDTKSIGWVFRAADPDNYYAMKLMTVSSGLSPKVALFKYLVVNGKQTQVGRVPIDLAVQPDTVFNVRMDVRGPQFTTYIQGQQVDSWTDDQLKAGGVGFLNEREERGKVKSVSIRYLSGAPSKRFTQKDSMEQTNDQWLWFVDNELVEALARTDVLDATSEKRPVQSSTLAKALALNMDGKTEQALREIREAPSMAAKTCPNWPGPKAHLEFQLGQFENALEDYQKVLGDAAQSQGRNLQCGPVPGEAEAL